MLSSDFAARAVFSSFSMTFNSKSIRVYKSCTAAASDDGSVVVSLYSRSGPVTRVKLSELS